MKIIEVFEDNSSKIRTCKRVLVPYYIVRDDRQIYLFPKRIQEIDNVHRDIYLHPPKEDIKLEVGEEIFPETDRYTLGLMGYGDIFQRLYKKDL